MKARVRDKLQEMWEAEYEGAEEPGHFPSYFSFQKRTTAARKVVDELSEEDRGAIEKMLSEKDDGLTPEMKKE